MSLLPSDALGALGVLAVLSGFFLLQSERVRFDDYAYLGMNAVGSLMIMASLIFKFNPASFLIEIF